MTSEIPGAGDIKPDKAVSINIVSFYNSSGIGFGKNPATVSIDILRNNSVSYCFYTVSCFIISVLVTVSRTCNGTGALH